MEKIARANAAEAAPCCTLRDGTVVAEYAQPYIVAEVNSSHRGDMETARRMIDAAASCGCDCVKFQSWSAKSLYSKSYYQDNPISRKIVGKLALAPEQLRELAAYCRERGVAYSSTPYSEAEVDYLVEECGAPFVKVASMEVNYPQFLTYIGRKGVPVVLSTGMSEMAEVERAVDLLRSAGTTQLVVLHCVSVYPTSLAAVNVCNILGLRERLPGVPIGFSDHTEGDVAAVAAVALGAALVEKHLTLDKSKVGMDNGMATEPEQMKRLVERCREAAVAMGSRERTLQPEELAQREQMRRSLVAARDIEAGTALQEADLIAKRPGTGIRPDEIGTVIGRRTKRRIEADTLLRPEDLA